MSDALPAFLEAAVRLAAPLALAALGEAITERGGVINIGLEGSIIAGALASALGALTWGSGVRVGRRSRGWDGGRRGVRCVHASAPLRPDHHWDGGDDGLPRFHGSGVSISLRRDGDRPLSPHAPTGARPALGGRSYRGEAFFAQAPTVYLAYLLAPLLWFYLYRTGWGLELRAAGEEPEAAEAAGVRVVRARLFATLFGGALGGVAGAHLALAHAGTFAEGMSAGRGFIAIAVVVLGRWNPLEVLLSALLFGAASALQFFLQTLGLDLPYQLFLALPYLLTLLALAGWVGRARAPAGLGRPWPNYG